MSRRSASTIEQIEQCVTIPEVATRLGVSYQLIKGELDAGRLAYIRIGGRRVIPLAALRSYLNDHTFGRGA